MNLPDDHDAPSGDGREQERPYLGRCGYCGDGLLRFWRRDGDLVALCDECELGWDDIEAVYANPKARADLSHHGQADRHWHPATEAEIEEAGYGGFIAGYSG